MISGIFHQGSGLGNQLFRYITTRTLAEDKGYKWGMYNSSFFKGKEFMQIDMGLFPDVEEMRVFQEKKVIENGVDIRGYDPEINFVQDETMIEGEFQDARYWEHRLDEIRKWLKVDYLPIADDVCIIGFRGGEYTLFPDLFLTQDYWNDCIGIMRQENPQMQFHVVTDDPITAKQFFPDFPITHDIGMDWRKIRHAKYAIIANSSFYILPRLLNEKGGMTLAPRYWARRNTKVWALPQNYYKQFTYI